MPMASVDGHHGGGGLGRMSFANAHYVCPYDLSMCINDYTKNDI